MKPEEVKKIQEAEKFVMPYGKFKGKRLDEVPTSYLLWLAENVDGDICDKADIVYQFRKSEDKGDFDEWTNSVWKV